MAATWRSKCKGFKFWRPDTEFASRLTDFGCSSSGASVTGSFHCYDHGSLFHVSIPLSLWPFQLARKHRSTGTASLCQSRVWRTLWRLMVGCLVLIRALCSSRSGFRTRFALLFCSDSSKTEEQTAVTNCLWPLFWSWRHLLHVQSGFATAPDHFASGVWEASFARWHRTLCRTTKALSCRIFEGRELDEICNKRMVQRCQMVNQVDGLALKVTFWLFWVLLLCNSVYPNMLFIFPESMRCRYTCAMLDVFFDLGYVLTYLVMVVIGTTELHVNVSVWGNFGQRSQLGFSNSTLPRIWCDQVLLVAGHGLGCCKTFHDLDCLRLHQV